MHVDNYFKVRTEPAFKGIHPFSSGDKESIKLAWEEALATKEPLSGISVYESVLVKGPWMTAPEIGLPMLDEESEQ